VDRIRSSRLRGGGIPASPIPSPASGPARNACAARTGSAGRRPVRQQVGGPYLIAVEVEQVAYRLVSEPRLGRQPRGREPAGPRPRRGGRVLSRALAPVLAAAAVVVIAGASAPAKERRSSCGRTERQVFARNLSGLTSRRVTGCRTAAIQRVASCVLRMPPGSQQGAPGGIRTRLPRLTWLDALVRIVEPDPAPFIHVGSDTDIRRRCHLIVTSGLDNHSKNAVELRGFEPLTSCMPCKRSTN
jgi:hypothetical protein